MYRLRAVLAALTLSAPSAVLAADISRIASSFEDDDPFGLFIDVGFERTQRRSKILREQLPPNPDDGTREYVNELWYTGVDARLNLDLAIGLYRDLQFSFGLPIVIVQNERWDYVYGNTPELSTLPRNCLRANGSLLDPNCPSTGAGAQALFPVPAESYRGGLGNMRFGLAYAFFNQENDETKPTWILGFDYEAPTAQQLDPGVPTDPDNRGNIGDRVHKYTLSTTLSRRIGVADPYFRLHYTIPVRGPGFYSNCDHRDLDPQNLGRPENCGTEAWDRRETGIQPPHTAGIVFGSEFNAYNQPAKHQRVALDLRAIGNYVSEGRYYNELSGVLRKLLYTGDYMQVGGMLALTAQASEALHLRASGTFLYSTEHALTDERIGKDLDGNGRVDITGNPSELNPNFDFRTDFVSRRFYAAENKSFRLELSASFSF